MDMGLRDDFSGASGGQPLFGIGDDLIRSTMCPQDKIGGIADIKYMGES